MKRILLTAVLLAATGTVTAANVGVSINVGQPGFYGRIDLGNVPQPELVYSAPVIIQPVPYGAVRQPIYLHVPPGHARDWGRYCGRYQACGQPVYFVQDNWYNNVYVPRYRERQGWNGRRDYHDDHRDGRDDHHGKGHGYGHDNGNGNGNGNGKHRDD